MKTRFIAWLVPRAIRLIVLFFEKTVRWQVVGQVAEGDERFLYGFWHARLLMMPKLFRRRGWHGYMLISEHRDGGFIADTMSLFHIPTVRGSTTRGGARAVLKMLRAVRDERRSLGITPDGPKGPREVMQMGTVQLAKKSGLPFVALCYATRRHWRVNSWDRFYIPKPFTRGVFIISEPVRVSPDEDDDAALARLQAVMDETQQRADSYFT